MRNVRLVTSDAHDGLRWAISEVYPEATWQRCVVHVKRGALAHLSFPREHRVKILTSNVQERMNCEFKRRAKVVQ